MRPADVGARVVLIHRGRIRFGRVVLVVERTDSDGNAVPAVHTIQVDGGRRVRMIREDFAVDESGTT